MSLLIKAKRKDRDFKKKLNKRGYEKSKKKNKKPLNRPRQQG